MSWCSVVGLTGQPQPLCLYFSAPTFKGLHQREGMTRRSLSSDVGVVQLCT